MALTRKYEFARRLKLYVGPGITSGDIVVVNDLLVVALTSSDSAGYISADLEGCYAHSVAAVNDAGNSAVAVGDAIYYNASDTPKLSKKKSGKLFGFALSTVTSGETGTDIPVRRCFGQMPTLPVLATNIFLSDELTGTGSEQDTDHGLGAVPDVVIAIPTDLTPATVGSYAATYGTHDGTHVKTTVTTGKKYRVLAFLNNDARRFS